MVYPGCIMTESSSKGASPCLSFGAYRRQPTILSGRIEASCLSPERLRLTPTLLGPEWATFQFGWVVPIQQELMRAPKGALMHTRCTGCATERWQAFSNLARGQSRGCQACSQPRGTAPPDWLVARCYAAQRRCTNPRDPAWPHYGGRGIRFEFPSPTAAAVWVVENLGLRRRLELDRHDNNGHYSPGNLRWATRRTQNFNKRSTKLSESWVFHQAEWPYTKLTTERMLRQGLTREQILAMAKEAVRMRRKCWRTIRERLKSLTS